MSRIYWDSMLFIYLLEGHPAYSARARHLLSRSYDRRDSLFTSYLALGEILAGVAKTQDAAKIAAIRSNLDAMGFSYLPFDGQAVPTFVQLRSQTRLKVADSIHLACAAAAGIDLLLTGDQQLVGRHIPGIQFVADFNTSVL